MKYFWWSRTDPDDMQQAKFYFHDPAFGAFGFQQKYQPLKDEIEDLLLQQYTEISWQTAQTMGFAV